MALLLTCLNNLKDLSCCVQHKTQQIKKIKALSDASITFLFLRAE